MNRRYVIIYLYSKQIQVRGIYMPYVSIARIERLKYKTHCRIAQIRKLN